MTKKYATMKILLLILCTSSGTPQFKYYLSPNFILVEVVNPIKGNYHPVKGKYHLLEVNKILVHHIDENSRKVERYDYKNIGKWSTNLSKTEFMKESAPFFLNGRECLERRFQITSSKDSSLSHLDNDMEEEKVKVYCKIPEIYEYLSEEYALKVLSPFYENDVKGFDFCIKTYYSTPDESESSSIMSISKIEEIEVPNDFFKKFLLIPEEKTKE